jgi:hypothetical protein
MEIERLRAQSWFKISLHLSTFQRGPASSSSILHPIPNDARYSHRDASSCILPGEVLLTRMDDGFTIAGIIFGGIHYAAWHSTFPTPVERTLWRISSLITAGILPLFYLLLLADFHFRKLRYLQMFLPGLEILVAVGYFIARLYLLVGVFRSLFFLPPSAFVTTWTSQVPHVS